MNFAKGCLYFPLSALYLAPSLGPDRGPCSLALVLNLYLPALAPYLYLPALYFYFILFKIYLQLTVNRKKRQKKYLAYLKTMLIYVNFHKKTYIKELLNLYIYEYNLYIYIYIYIYIIYIYI